MRTDPQSIHTLFHASYNRLKRLARRASLDTDAALAHSRAKEAKGFSFSYDMLGEAAMTSADASRFFADYEAAIHAVGQAAQGRGSISSCRRTGRCS